MHQIKELGDLMAETRVFTSPADHVSVRCLGGHVLMARNAYGRWSLMVVTVQDGGEGMA